MYKSWVAFDGYKTDNKLFKIVKIPHAKCVFRRLGHMSNGVGGRDKTSVARSWTKFTDLWTFWPRHELFMNNKVLWTFYELFIIAWTISWTSIRSTYNTLITLSKDKCCKMNYFFQTQCLLSSHSSKFSAFV